jgi:hypothetical protein
MTDSKGPEIRDMGEELKADSLEHLLWRLRHNETAKHLCCLAADAIERLSSPRPEDREAVEADQLRAALQEIIRTPSMPFPDPVAHSWQAWGRAVFLALRTTHDIARRALSKQEG